MATEVKLHLAVEGAAEVVQAFEKTGQEIGKTGDVVAKTGEALSTWQQNMRGVAASMRETTEASGEVSKAAQRIMDRYDPLGTKLRALTSDMALMRREMGDSTAAGAIKAFEGLEAEIEKVQGLMAKAGVAGEDGFKKTAEAADKSAFATAGAKRELLVLGHEAMTGNFSRIPGSMMVLAERMDLTTMLMSPMTLGIVAIGIAAAAMGVQIAKGASEQREMNDALIMTGNYAGTTSDGLNNMAHAAVVAGGSLSESKKVVTELAASGKYTAEQIGAVSEAAIAMEHATGGNDKSVASLVKQFESLAVQAGAHARYSDTISKAVLKLDDEYHFLTTSVYEQIRGLEAEGKATAASALATDTFAKSTKDRAAEMTADLGLVQRAWNSIKETIGNAGDALGNIGKKSTAASEVARLTAKVAALSPENYGTPDINGVMDTTPFAEGTAAAKKYNAAVLELQDAKKNLILVDNLAAAAGEKAQNQSKANHAIAAIEAEDMRLKAEKLSKLDAALGAYHQHLDDLREAGAVTKQLDPDTIAAHEAALAKQYADHSKVRKDGYDAIAASMDAANEKALQELQTGEKLTAAEQFHINSIKAIDQAIRDRNLSVDKANELVQKMLDVEKNIAAGTAFVQGEKDKAKALADTQKAYDTAIAAVDRSGASEINALQKAIEAAKQHNSEIGKTKEQIDLVKAAIADQKTAQDELDASTIQSALDRLSADKDWVAANPEVLAIYSGRLAALRQLIAGEKELAQTRRTGAVADAEAQAAKVSAEEWKKGLTATDNYARSIFDTWALNGGNAGQKIADTTKKALADAFYSVTLKPMVMQVYMQVMGTSGGTASTVANLTGGSSGSGSVLSQASNANSVYNFASNGMAGIGSTVSTVGNLVGSASISAYGAGMGMTTEAAAAAAEAYTTAAASIAASDATLAATYTATASSITAGAATTSAFSSAMASIPVWGWIALALSTQLGGPKIDQVGNGLSMNLSASGASSAQNRTDYTEDHHGLFGIGAYTTHNSSYADASQATTSYINAAVTTVTAATKAYAAAIGLSTDAVNGYTEAIDVTLTGLSAADAQAEVDKAIGKFTNDMVTSAYGGALSALSKTGETSSTTLQRVATEFVTVNSVIKLLGGTLLAVGIDGATASDKLVQLMGGLSSFQAVTTDFAKNYLTESQQRAATLNNISATLKAGGLDITPEQLSGMSRQQVADYVAQQTKVGGSLDLTTDQGRKAYAAVMSVQGSFASLTPTLEQAAQAADAAQKANQAAYDAALQNYGTSAEQRANAVAKIQASLSASGVDLTADQISNASRQDARNLWQGYHDQHTAAGDAAAQAIMDQQAAFAAITPATNAATAAIGGGSSGSGGGLTGALDSLSTSLQSTTDSIFAEVRRIQGLEAGNGSVGYAQSQANFAIATAQARAGDTTAAAALPALSQAMLTLAEANTSTLLELRMIQAQTADSLSTTGTMIAGKNGLTIPQFAVGTNYVPQDMVALIHRGETIIPDGFNPAQFMATVGGSGSGGGGSYAEFTRVMTYVAAKLDEIATATQGSAGSTLSLWRLFQFCAPTGSAIQTVAAPT